MLKKNVAGIEFVDPDINISWNLKEEDFVRLLKCDKKDSRFYLFKANLHPVGIDVINRISFHDSGFKMEIIVSQTLVERPRDSKVIRINTHNTNFLHDYAEKNFGVPKCFSRIFSALEKPFYHYRWTFDHLKLFHKYQDSVIGFYECLLFEVKY